MPTLSRYFVRSALICLAMGFTTGGLILAAKAGAIFPNIWSWLAPHIVLLLFGWLAQLAIGVAYWILPRMLGADRGRPRWAWASFIAFQAGITLTLLSMVGLWRPGWRWLFVPGVIAQSVGTLLFVIHAWPRVKPAFVRADMESGE